jgi:threonine dehydrogenase-like Zn-dependent dehydrogenase
LDLVEAALCEPTAVVLKAIARLRGVHRGNLPKLTCCVAGAGPIGHLCAQVLALEGCRVAAFDRDPRRLQYFGIGGVETIGDIRECCEADVIVEATGDPDVLTRLLEHGRAGMTVLSLGLPYARRKSSLENVVAYDKIVIGSVGSAHDDFDQALRLLPALNLDPFREHIIPLQEYRAGWTVCRQRDRLKTMLRVHA